MFDVLGRAHQFVDELERATQTAYDNVDRVVQTILPAVGGSWPVWNYGYDIYGNQLTSTDPEGNVHTTQFDNQHRAATRIAPVINLNIPLIESIVDDSPTTTSEFTFTGPGPWTQVTGSGHDTDYHPIAAGTGDNAATWTFNNLLPSRQYEVFITWNEDVSAATNSTFTVLDGAASEGQFVIDQTVAPVAHDTGEGSDWQSLGMFSLSSTTLEVTLSDVVATHYSHLIVERSATQEGMLLVLR